MGLDRSVGKGVDLIAIGHVSGYDSGFTARSGDHLGSFFKTSDTDVGNDHVCTGLGERDGGLATNTARGTGDDGGAAMQ
jgi:hypothetical protein